VTSRGRGIGRAALLVTALTAISALLGFGRDVVIAAVFGASGGGRALRRAGADEPRARAGRRCDGQGHGSGGARELATDGGAARAAHTVVVVASMTLVVLGVASVLMWVAAGPVVTVLAPGFHGSQAELARTVTRVVLAATVLIAGTNLLAAAAQAHRRFFWAGVQGIPFNLVMIAAAAVLGPRYGVAALAVGFVAGSAARLLCQLVPLRRIGVR